MLSVLGFAYAFKADTWAIITGLVIGLVVGAVVAYVMRQRMDWG